MNRRIPQIDACLPRLLTRRAEMHNSPPSHERSISTAPAKPAGWELPLAVCIPTLAFVLLPTTWPRWLTMWLLALGIYTICKWLTWIFADRENVSVIRQAAYLFAWCGLDANAFLHDSTERKSKPPNAAQWLSATVNLAIGLLLLCLAPKWSPVLPSQLVGWIGMLGIVLILHFGSFQLLSCFWRSRGVRAKPLMLHPLRSTSVSSFWSHRWNTAFRDMAHEFLFRPWSKRLGPQVALFAGFLFSGIVHDLVISLPAGGGYGLPTAYFLLQALGVLVERSSRGRKLGLGQGPRGWLFALLVVAGPANWLFHRPFNDHVILPFMQFISRCG